jgi:4-amino-4-deoxy-L-arabinose transferase-like glycosyltransferase
LLWTAFRVLRSAESAPRLNRFAIVWFVAMFLVLSASQFKRADYLLPLYPAAAIYIGCAAEHWLSRRLLVVVALACLVGWQVHALAIEPAEQAKEEKRAFARMIRELSPQEVMLFRTESHLLAFHLGRPIITRVEWHDLNDWLAAPGPHLVVMPPEYVYPAQQIVRSRKLAVAARLEDFTAGPPHRPLVLLRTQD